MSDDISIDRATERADLLQTWLNRKVLEVFEPNLFFYSMGEKPTMPAGYNTISWAKFDQVDEDDVTENTGALDGQTPTPVEINATVISATPYQYVITACIPDIVQGLNVISFLEGATKAIGRALARRIDKAIQVEIMAGTRVMYAGGKTARSSLGSTDIMTAQLLNRADAILRYRLAPSINGSYVCFIHPFQLADLRSETGVGNWIEVNKYSKPDKIFSGEVGMLNGIRIVIAPFIQTFSSATTVYPALVLGAGAYGVGDFMALETFYVGNVASAADPAAQRRYTSAKIAFAAKRLQEDAMLRIETGVTAIV